MDMKYGFGPHLMLDCYGCSKEKLADSSFVFNVLDALPKKINLTRIASPSVFKYHNGNAEEWGITGIIQIAESHISIHTFPDRGHAFIDIFSCKDFDTDFARSELLNLFGATHHEVVLLNGGMVAAEPQPVFH